MTLGRGSCLPTFHGTQDIGLEGGRQEAGEVFLQALLGDAGCLTQHHGAGGSASDWALGRGNLAGPHTRIRMKPAGPGDTAGRELGVRAVARSAAATAGSAAVPQNCPNRGSVQ